MNGVGLWTGSRIYMSSVNNKIQWTPQHQLNISDGNVQFAQHSNKNLEILTNSLDYDLNVYQLAVCCPWMMLPK